MSENQETINQNYINEEIIEKGYNPEEFANFVARTRGVDISVLPLKTLKQSVEFFKTEKMNLTYGALGMGKNKSTPKDSNKQPIKKSKTEETPVPAQKESLFDIFYSPVSYSLNCVEQDDNPLKLLIKQTKSIHITVSDPEKISTEKLRFLKTTDFVYKIYCRELNSTTKKTYQDVEWLRNRLYEAYPFILLPPLKKSSLLEKLDFQNEKDLQESKVRYLNKFFEVLTKKKIVRSSPILCFFLTMSEDNFAKMKDTKQSKFLLKKDLSNYITFSGKMNFDLTKGKAVFANSLLRMTSPCLEYYEQLNKHLEGFSKDMKNAGEHLKEVGTIFERLNQHARKTIQKENVIKTFENLSKIFSETATAYTQTSEIFNNEIKEYFDFMRMEFNTIIPLYKEFEDARNEYELNAQKLRAKKEALFVSKNFSKWETQPGEKIDFQAISNDKDAAFEKMCYAETIDVNLNKKKLVLIINVMMKQYEKMVRYQDERMKEFVENFSKNHKEIMGKEMNTLKLFAF